MAERYVQSRLNGGGRSSEEVEPPPESLEVSKDLSSEPNGSSSEKKKRKRNTLNFDFDSPPKKVTWILNSSSEAPGSWTPFINGEKVPEHIRQEWDAAFTQHVHGVEASSDSSSEEDDVNDVGVTLEAGANLEDDVNDVGVKLETGENLEAGAVEHEDVGVKLEAGANLEAGAVEHEDVSSN